MKIAKVAYDKTENYAIVKNKGYQIIDGDIFGKWNPGDKIIPLDVARLLAPVDPQQIIAIGLNYLEHARELGNKVPTEPVIFLKAHNSLTGPNSDIVLPKIAPDEVDFECELVVVIGKAAKNITPRQADDYILGFTCGNDISARDCQHRRDKQWARAKSFDSFAPVGPWIETDIQADNLNIKQTLNGTVMQDSNTSNMIFGYRELVAFLSTCMTLLAGSIIFTGTPPGVGAGRTPKVFLQSGDSLTVEIEGIGELQNSVVMEE
jgi:2-keto-4-pentenoate hydratase/2-oxohepta-3-ene-1,7-dioic acid hydratase in catechol pathway